MVEEKLIKKAVKIIKNSNHIVVFTGAGISTESGIADFRSEGGLWSRYDPSIYASYFYFLQDPSKFWEMHKELEEIVTEADPNPAHYAIAELEKMGKILAVITQNIDMLHQRAGTTSYNVPIYELHGSYGVLHCIKCEKEYKYGELDYSGVDYPVCNCNKKGFIKPKVVLFGEALPLGILEKAEMACRDCDCFLMVGSSLAVSPANFMPSLAKNHGAKVIYVNRDNTCMDNFADLFLMGSASKILTEILERIRI